MQTLKNLFVILITITLFTSCGGSDDDSGGGTESTEIFIRFDANGVSFDYADPAIAQSANISITGFDLDGSLSIWLPIGFTTGTFDVTGSFTEPGDYKIFFDSINIGVENLAGVSGSITITSITDNYIEGTFSFTGEDNGITVTVTNGEFRSVTL